MKKLAAILLLCCFALNLFGIGVFFYLQKKSIKSEMKAYLKKADHADVTTFIFDEQQLRVLVWEEDHEFSYNGEMYDVIDKTTKGHQTIIRCISDKKETALLKDFQQKTKEQSNQKNSSLSKLLTLQFVAVESAEESTIANSSIKHYSFFSESISKRIGSILKPPPQAV